ncbi:fatty acid desaturase [Sphingobium sp. B11D3B]|uniref:DUF3325 domain-containing protein n=1 Tax=Sphingobium sp. B11D3B TaxID=2940575 RepID=UPI002225B87D|nr:DUF3325 domain-containing protein [Sphingobium sp. B11D3B]MCW2389645.1 fatty acid desaturase [Sphingobium sp. B11D3B]
MIHVLILFTALGGFAALLLAMTRHQQDWLRRKLPPGRSRALRLAGFLLLALAFGAAGLGFGWGYGAVVWFGWITLAAGGIVAANVNRDRIVRRVRP